MSFENIMGIAGQAMDAQTIRINAAVSNIANADTQAGSPMMHLRPKESFLKAFWLLRSIKIGATPSVV